MRLSAKMKTDSYSTQTWQDRVLLDFHLLKSGIQGIVNQQFSDKRLSQPCNHLNRLCEPAARQPLPAVCSAQPDALGFFPVPLAEIWGNTQARQGPCEA
jgi:hypothetical protein